MGDDSGRGKNLYFCRSCGFSFRRKNPPLRCPYCGKNDLLLKESVNDFRLLELKD